MPDSVVPDPEFQPRDDLAGRRNEQVVEETKSRAAREAAALIAAAQPFSIAQMHEVVSLAWASGFIAGLEASLDKINAAFDSAGEGDRS